MISNNIENTENIIFKMAPSDAKRNCTLGVTCVYAFYHASGKYDGGSQAVFDH